jgi:hypothetical protein
VSKTILVAALSTVFLGFTACILACRGQQTLSDSAHAITVPLTGGFMLMRPQTGPIPAPVVESYGTKVIEYKVAPNAEVLLVAPQARLTGFSKLSFRLWSQQNSVAVVVVEDRDKAKFHAIIPLQAGRWTASTLLPSNFQINDDSPVKKTVLDSRLVVGPTIIAQDSKMLGLQGANILRLSSMEITYGQRRSVAALVPQNIHGTTILPAGKRNGIAPVFANAEPVSVLGYSGPMEDPVVSADGAVLFFDSFNDGGLPHHL